MPVSLIIHNSPSLSVVGVDASHADFWSIWLRYRDELYRCCLRWMGNAIDAEDALSLAMLKAKAKLSDYHDVVSNLRAWLYQLTKNLCLDLQRQRRRRAMVCDNVEVLCQSGTDQSGLDSPVDYVLQEELGAFCRAAIAALPPKLNAVMVLRVQEDMSYDDIAERLDLSAANVRKRVSQARAILRRRLADYEQGFELKTLACA